MEALVMEYIMEINIQLMPELVQLLVELKEGMIAQDFLMEQVIMEETLVVQTETLLEDIYQHTLIIRN